MAEEKRLDAGDALDAPTKPKRVNFVNKNLAFAIGGLFVGALTLAILPGAIKEDRAREAATPPVAADLAKTANIEAERSGALAEELQQQREQAEREEAARLRAEEEARRRLTEGETRRDEPSVGPITTNAQPRARTDADEAARRAEEARLRHEESVRTSPLIAASGSVSGSGSALDGLSGRSLGEIARRVGEVGATNSAQDELSQAALKLLRSRMEAPPEEGGLPIATAPAIDRNKAWVDQYSSESGTKRPLIRDEPAAVPVVLQGAVIPAAIITEINSDLPGQITAQVTMDVYDSHGRALLIPKGSRLVGNYNNDVNPGQERVMAAFRRLIRPDGTSIDLEGMTSADRLGQSGVKDQVNNHFWKMFGSSLMIAGIAWLTERDQPGTVVVGGGGAASPEKASGQILKDMSEQMLKRNTRIPPTLIIRQGHKFNVVVTRDIALPPIAVALR